MGYQQAMEAAGARVLEFKEFGSYQGDWAALVEFKGETGFVFGSYGSCSGCDAFEAEFGWDDPEDPEKLAAFGIGYLQPPLSNKQDVEIRIEKLKADDWFDGEEKEMLEWCMSVFEHYKIKE